MEAVQEIVHQICCLSLSLDERAQIEEAEAFRKRSGWFRRRRQTINGHKTDHPNIDIFRENILPFHPQSGR